MENMVLNNILDFCKKIQEYLANNADPHVSVRITNDSISIERIEEFIPLRSEIP